MKLYKIQSGDQTIGDQSKQKYPEKSHWKGYQFFSFFGNENTSKR